MSLVVLICFLNRLLVLNEKFARFFDLKVQVRLILLMQTTAILQKTPEPSHRFHRAIVELIMILIDQSRTSRACQNGLIFVFVAMFFWPGYRQTHRHTHSQTNLFDFVRPSFQSRVYVLADDEFGIVPDCMASGITRRHNIWYGTSQW